MTERRARWVLALIVGLYLVLGGAYSLVNPIFESPDEALNYANVRFLIEEHRLPVLEPGKPTKAHHPPLYYALGALFTFWVPNEHYDTIVSRENPFWGGNQLSEPGVDNKNLYLHDPDRESFRDVVLGVFLLRWFSLLLGAGTVFYVYKTARELFYRQQVHWPVLAVSAAVLVALNPMFLFMNASVHEDPLAYLVTAAMFYVTAKVLMRGPTTRRMIALGLLMGLAILTKFTCLPILPTVGLGVFWRLWCDRDRIGWRGIGRFIGIMVGLLLLISGWWFVRNQALYGDPTSLMQEARVWGARENAPDLLAALSELGFLYDSAWGAFGYGQISMPAWTYGLVRLIGLLALGGLILHCIRRLPLKDSWKSSSRALLILSSAPLAMFLAVFARMTVNAVANFGRYLFVTWAILAPLYVLGLSEWVPFRARRGFVVGLAVFMLALALFGLVGVLWPAYAPPKMLSLEQVQAQVQPTDVRFDHSIRLIGYAIDRKRVLAGEELMVTLCWEALASMEKDYVYFVHLVGQDETKVGVRDTHPGLGRYPTSRWTSGNMFCDDVCIPIAEWAPTPAVYQVAVGWYRYEEQEVQEHLPIYDAKGALLDFLSLDKVKVAPEVYPTVEVPNRLDADLDGQIALLGYELDPQVVTPGGDVNVVLYWMAQASVSADYVVFVHLAAPSGPPHAQADGPPQSGAYPTSFWDEGEVVADTRTIRIPADLPAGDYDLVAGMYLLETGERLHWLSPAGSVQGDAVPLTQITIQGIRSRYRSF